MEEGNRLIGWVLHYFLDVHYGGNKSKMATHLGLGRHTLWRAFRAVDGGKGKVSTLVVQQLMSCCCIKSCGSVGIQGDTQRYESS